jgi:hypothetical protein
MNKHSPPLTVSASPLLSENLVAIDEFIARAQLLSEVQWETPRAANKWTPCQEAQHLILSFGFFTEAVLGRQKLALQVSPERSQSLYATVMPKLRAGEPLPTGVRTPAHADPTTAAQISPDDRDTVLRALVSAGRAFHTALLQTATVEAARRVQHPYFGLISIEEFSLFAAAHTRHHMSFLPTVPSPAG